MSFLHSSVPVAMYPSDLLKKMMESLEQKVTLGTTGLDFIQSLTQTTPNLVIPNPWPDTEHLAVGAYNVGLLKPFSGPNQISPIYIHHANIRFIPRIAVDQPLGEPLSALNTYNLCINTQPLLDGVDSTVVTQFPFRYVWCGDIAQTVHTLHTDTLIPGGIAGEADTYLIKLGIDPLSLKDYTMIPYYAYDTQLLCVGIFDSSDNTVYDVDKCTNSASLQKWFIDETERVLS